MGTSCHLRLLRVCACVLAFCPTFCLTVKFHLSNQRPRLGPACACSSPAPRGTPWRDWRSTLPSAGESAELQRLCLRGNSSTRPQHCCWPCRSLYDHRVPSSDDHLRPSIRWVQWPPQSPEPNRTFGRWWDGNLASKETVMNATNESENKSDFINKKYILIFHGFKPQNWLEFYTQILQDENKSVRWNKNVKLSHDLVLMRHLWLQIVKKCLFRTGKKATRSRAAITFFDELVLTGF